MSRKQNGLALTLAVVGGCLALLLLLILLATQTSAEGTNPAIGFPVVLGVLVVLATVVALVWRSRSRKDDDSGSRRR